MYGESPWDHKNCPIIVLIWKFILNGLFVKIYWNSDKDVDNKQTKSVKLQKWSAVFPHQRIFQQE